MAHEINNPLSSVVNAVYLALKDPALSTETRALLEAADRELIRVSQFATQTLRFHKQSHAPTHADLGEIMDSVLSMYAPRVRTSAIELRREYRTQAKMLCYSSELRQVFANLIGNALDAMPSGGQLRVRIREAADAAEHVAIRITIADDGHGIPSHLQKRIFEPFVSTKETTGMGLGLWVSEEIIRKHKGRIAMRSSTSEHRHGTAFSLYFPLRTFED
jgi:signal transduction histidine kinase